MAVLVFDLETVADPDLHYEPKPGGDAFPPPPFHKVAAIGLLWLNDDMTTGRIGHAGGRSEAAMLSVLVNAVRRRPLIVTFNGNRFDLPVLTARSMTNGIQFSELYEGKRLHRYDDRGHVDLCDWLAHYGSGRPASLDSWAKTIGLPGKTEGVDGSKVDEMIAAGKFEDVRRYVERDVISTAAVYLRFLFVRGMSKDRYRMAMESLLATTEADPRHADFVAQINRTKLLEV